MNKIFKGSILVVILISFLFAGSSVVSAASKYSGTIYEAEKLDGIYYYKHREDTDRITYETHNFHEQASIHRRSSDDAFVYCIESWTPITGAPNGSYKESDRLYTSKLTTTDLNHLNIIGIFGYGYKDKKYDHTDKKWYAITQYVMWKYQAPRYEHYFVSSLTSTTPLHTFDAEIKELEDMVKEYEKKPVYSSLPKNAWVNDSVTLSDDNEVISQYSILAPSGVSLTRMKNKKDIVVDLQYGGSKVFSFEKERTYFDHFPLIYTSDDYQDALYVGDPATLFTSYSFNVSSGSISILKYGEILKDYQEQNFIYEDVKKDGITFGLYAAEDLKNNVGDIIYYKDYLIDTLVTGEKDTFSNLMKGKYYIKELDTLDGYVLDENSYYVTIDDENKDQTIELNNYYQDLKVELKKYVEVKENKKTKIIPGENIKFGLYNKEDIKLDDGRVILKENTLISEYLTNEEGLLIIRKHLPYGKYYLKELTKNDLYNECLDIREFEFKFNDHPDYVIKLEPIYNYLKYQEEEKIDERIIEEKKEEKIEEVDVPKTEKTTLLSASYVLTLLLLLFGALCVKR